MMEVVGFVFGVKNARATSELRWQAKHIEQNESWCRASLSTFVTPSDGPLPYQSAAEVRTSTRMVANRRYWPEGLELTADSHARS
jgi:hypothetical protein